MPPGDRLPSLPPGRSGRLWLAHRISMAERAAERLDQKIRGLLTRCEASARRAAETRAAWEEAARSAEVWFLRAALLAGEPRPPGPGSGVAAEVSVRWTTTLGVTHPAEGTSTAFSGSPLRGALPTAALARAAWAHREAVEAAVRHAVALETHRALEAELLQTRQRLRGIRDRWLPRLHDAQAELQLRLDEEERAELTRLRWSTGRR